MGIEPRKVADRITFWTDHIPPFTTNAVAIGTTVLAVDDLETKTEAAATALSARNTARQALKSANANLRTAVSAMSSAGMGIVENVRSKARTGGDAIYDLAQIPVPATPEHKGEPGTPTDYKLELFPDGTLLTKWKCANPQGTQGTMYQVYRSIGASDDYEYLGGTGKKEFYDDTIPAGATRINYKIQGVRSTSIGMAGMFTVNFGTNASGGTTATLAEMPAAKLAA